MSLDGLKEKIIALEMGRARRQVLPLGLGVVDEALQGGLDLGAIHEITGPAAFLWAQMIVHRRGGTTFWLCEDRAELDYNPAALLQYGGLPERFRSVYLRDGETLLNAAYEVLASKVVGCVLLDLKKPVNQTRARKLQLAVQGTSSLGLIINSTDTRNIDAFAGAGMVSSAVTRWHARVCGWRDKSTRLELSLTKNRRGHPRQWRVEIEHATHHLYLASPVGEREIDPGQSGFGT